MEIRICNYLAGSFLLEQEPDAWDAIILLDPGLDQTSFVEEHSARHLYLRFDDITQAEPGKRLPTLDQVGEALAFAAPSDKLLVCCRAGQSRSAAMAFLIGYQHCGEEFARSLLNPRRHAPNQLLVDLGASLLKDASVLSVFHSWRDCNRRHRLIDYVDEIAAEFDDLEARGAVNRIAPL